MNLTTATPTPPPATPPPVPIGILVVDDEPKNLTVLETVLNDPGYHVVRASTAEEALLALIREDFALIILDVRMPDISGFELAKLIKDRKRTASIPIIFLTAYYNEDQHIVEGYGAGAVDYLHKPVNAGVLRSKVSVFAELHRKNRALAAEVAERRLVEEQLSKLNSTLELRVLERTEALRSKAEELLRVNRALEKSNAELESFTYAASHDLKEPLRGINVYAQLLQRAAAARLTEADQKKVNSILELSQGMSVLIESLLRYSKAGSAELTREPVNLAEVVDSVVTMLRLRIEESGGVVAVQPLPVVPCDRVQVREVFSNLVLNGLKYNDREEKRIEVGCDQSQADPVFFVRDNGIGIAPEDRKRIFAIFRRLHGRDEYGGGTGAGLTIARKVVERHGGQMWVESEVGVGSVFYFTLSSSRAEGESSTPK